MKREFIGKMNSQGNSLVVTVPKNITISERIYEGELVKIIIEKVTPNISEGEFYIFCPKCNTAVLAQEGETLADCTGCDDEEINIQEAINSGRVFYGDVN